ncbi:MAG: Flp pilus assembly complex ATPase component TadA [Proteobacteria bacterium]|nr:AAA family ATPase [Desulfobulbaceae bacterium]MBU4153662.1 Flp pilus assembly complex ATPase component TadA [Pseudomonadota bacterium]
MYENYYGLTSKAFDLIPDPDKVYMSEAHEEALAILRYGVIDRKGFLLLTGGVGTGKTTLLQLLVKSLDAKVHLCLIANPTLSLNDFYYYLAAKYGLREYEGNKAKFLLDFADFLKQCRENKERVLLIIDEAHVLPVELLEEIRLLSNQEYQDFGVMSVFLVGQPELNERLGDARLLPLRQRIGIRFHLQPFAEEETKRYILFRLAKAGVQRGDIFSDNAIRLIHTEGHGVPRLINVLCDQAMLAGFAEGKPVIDVAIIRDCVREIRIPGEQMSFSPSTTVGVPLVAEKPKRSGLYLWVIAGLIIFMAGGAGALYLFEPEMCFNWLQQFGDLREILNFGR